MKHFLILVLVLSSITIKAQEELSLFYHNNVFQSGLLMPAYAPNSNFNLGIGSTYLHADLRGPRATDFFVGTAFLEELANNITRNYLSGDASFHYIDIGFKRKDWHFRMGYNSNTNAYFDFSPEFAQLFTRGNGDKIGQSIDLGPDLFLRQSAELYLGASYNIYDYYRIGGNIKFISGSFDLSTPRSELSLTTGEEIYELSVENDYLINLSFNDLDFNSLELIPFSSPLQDNIGFSADFGFQYLTDNWDVSASLLDVGLIRWKANALNIKSEGSYQFDGFTFQDINIDTLTQLSDTLQSIFAVDLSNNSYTTYTNAKIILGGEYHLDKWHFGGMLYGEWKQNRFLPAAGVNIRRNLWNFWDIGMSYAYKNNTYSNLGLSSVMNIGAVQLYVLSDNVVGIFLPLNRKKFNLRAGVNLNFGRPKKKEEVIPETRTAALF